MSNPRASGWKYLRLRVQSAVALTAWRYEHAAGITIALMASAYAVFQFVFVSLNGPVLGPTDDLILRTRIASPALDPSIVILDIDERSLALLATTHGRWPWGREIFADALEKLQAAKPAATLFNLMVSDPDIRNPDGDALLDYVASSATAVAYPLIRLAPVNDSLSELKVGELPGARNLGQGDLAATIALILPLLDSMRRTAGMANNAPDEDGVVRRYPLSTLEAGWQVPSIVHQAIQLAGQPTAHLPETIVLNWRNKTGRYPRISFVDFLQMNPEEMLAFKDRLVVVGVSAPGISQTVPVAVGKLEDGNEILATALDDARNQTWLKTIPAWMELMIALLAAWGLLLVGTRDLVAGTLEAVFWVTEFALVGISILAASFTSWLIDLTFPIATLLAVFSALKVTSVLAARWSRARPGFRFQLPEEEPSVVLVGYSLEWPGNASRSRVWLRQLVKLAGLRNLIVLDDVFEGDSLLSAEISGLRFYVVLASGGRFSAIQEIFEGVEPGAVQVQGLTVNGSWDPLSPEFRHSLVEAVLAMALHIVSEQLPQQQRG